MPGGFSLELDTAESARLWHAGWPVDPASARMVMNFVLPTRQAVDDRYAELTEAGYPGAAVAVRRLLGRGTRSWLIRTAMTSA